MSLRNDLENFYQKSKKISRDDAFIEIVSDLGLISFHIKECRRHDTLKPVVNITRCLCAIINDSDLLEVIARSSAAGEWQSYNLADKKDKVKCLCVLTKAIGYTLAAVERLDSPRLVYVEDHIKTTLECLSALSIYADEKPLVDAMLEQQPC